MGRYTTVNILDLLEAVGEEDTKEILADFKWPLNKEIEVFLNKNAIDFARRKMSITYLIVNENGKVIAYFTLTHKPALVSSNLLSNSSKKKIERYARLDEETKAYSVSAFLIAQFGKNAAYTESSEYSGIELMDRAIDILKNVQRQVGGGVVFLECEDKLELLNFYQNEQNRFIMYGERYSEMDQTLYKQLLKFF